MKNVPMEDRLILALDVNSIKEAAELLGSMKTPPRHLKVGHRLFAAGGASFLGELMHRGHRIFLDLKVHDIPNTVAQAIDTYAAMGIWAITVHAGGGEPMMAAAAGAAKRYGTLVLGVTVLTSFDAATWEAVTPGCTMDCALTSRAAAAASAGIAGLVCSPQDLSIVTKAAPELLTVVPGIRMDDDANGDQARPGTPEAAIKSGASYIVVGRPIIKAEFPETAFRRMVASMEKGV